MPYDLSACGLVTVCQLRAGGTGNTIAIGNDGGGVYIETEGTISSRNIRIQNGNSSFSAYSSLNVSGNDQAVWFNTNSATRMYINSSGRVGIGTNSPSTNLHVQGTCNTTISNTTFWNFDFAGAEVTNLSNCPGSTAGFALIGGAGRGSVSAIANLLETTGAGSLGFFTGGGATGTVPEKMRINSTGNVGIGTTTPNIAGFGGRMLTVNSNGSYQGYEIGVNGTSQGTFIASPDAVFISSRQNVPIIFETSAAVAERMRITSAGNVGINTTSPDTRLHIRNCVNGGTNNFLLTLQNTCTVSDARAGIAFLDNENTVGSGGISGASIQASNNGVDGAGNLLFSTLLNGAVTERMRMTSAGNVGIATTSPSYKLHVNGTFYAAGSSQDYKEGICKYDTDSCMFMKLKPVTYQYKDEFKHLGKELKSQTQIGLIAEEVAEVAPELAILVKENDNDVVRNVDYEKLTIVLLSEVQKLRKELDDLKTK